MSSVRRKLLVVEDDALTRNSLSDFFSETGHCVRTAEDGSAALSKLQQEVPDIVLSDLYMPGMSGFERLSIVRLSFPTIRTIAMSGSFSDDHASPGIHADAIYRKGDLIEGLVDFLDVIAR